MYRRSIVGSARRRSPFRIVDSSVAGRGSTENGFARRRRAPDSCGVTHRARNRPWVRRRRDIRDACSRRTERGGAGRGVALRARHCLRSLASLSPFCASTSMQWRPPSKALNGMTYSVMRRLSKRSCRPSLCHGHVFSFDARASLPLQQMARMSPARELDFGA
ncbi:MAG: hypothetical protein QOD67_1026 [Caballeronia sp.]|nr:hypothetical protein [Caballeronia sp.]